MTTPPNPPPPDEPAGEPASPYGQPGAAPGPYGQPGGAPGPYGQPGAQPGAYGQPGAQPGAYGQPAGAPSPYGQPMPPSPAGGYGVGGPPVPLIAGMGDRLLARIIDFVLLSVVGVVLAVPVVGAMVGTADPVTGQPSDASIVAAVVLLCVYVVITLLYEVVLIAIRGQTVGKQVMRLTVRREADGSLPGWGPSFVRWLVPVGAGLVTFCIGGVGQLLVYISPFFDGTGRNQGWHDKAAKTLVVKG